MALKALSHHLLLFVLALAATPSLAAEDLQADNAAKNLLADNTSITVGYNGFVSLIALALVLAAIAGVVALLAGATGGAAGYEAPTEYGSAPGPSAYEKVYSVLNSLKEAARKYQ